MVFTILQGLFTIIFLTGGMWGVCRWMINRPLEPAREGMWMGVIGISIITGFPALLATSITYWNIKTYGFLWGSVVGYIFTVVLDVLFVLLVVVIALQRVE